MPFGSIDLTLAVLTYEGEGLLNDCLQSILRSEVNCNTEILVVDNGSTTPVQLVHPSIRVVRLEQNVGNIEGMNRCFREAQCEWVLFIANDVRLHPDCVAHLWAHRTYFDVVQPVLYQPDEQIDNVGIQWVWPGYGRRVRTIQPPYTTDAFAATCFLMHRKLFDRLEGFDARLGISHEDIDFSLKMRNFGVWCGSRYCPEARATHLMGQTIGRVTTNPLTGYYHRARMQVIRRHYCGLNRLVRLGLVWLLDALAALRRL